MRPPEFTGGNKHGERVHDGAGQRASMRPPEFTGGNSYGELVELCCQSASMRPPEFTGGNTVGGADYIVLTRQLQ